MLDGAEVAVSVICSSLDAVASDSNTFGSYGTDVVC